ncbi:MAG: metallophosphoesterase [Oscillospiraceae bacterium]|nr:metallophosphoesterase [Oscillospiraceae bacterium]MBR0450687.1 metallophosphoesterase [Oscillospiraceae bacterium]
MGLFAIGDLHLHFQTDIKVKGQTKGVWRDHERKFKNACDRQITDKDTLVLVGDHTWGKNLSECEEDFSYIESLPGRKILLRGNHDMFWDAKKTSELNERFQGRLEFLQNNYYSYEDYALVGTKGFTFEGPFYLNRKGQIIGWDEEREKHADSLIAREAERLRVSFEAAKADGFRKFIMFLHYPPTNILEEESIFTKMAKEYGAEQVIYAHSHGEMRFHDSLEGMVDGVYYSLVSGDFLKWCPKKIL